MRSLSASGLQPQGPPPPSQMQRHAGKSHLLYQNKLGKYLGGAMYTPDSKFKMNNHNKLLAEKSPWIISCHLNRIRDGNFAQVIELCITKWHVF